MIDSHTVTDKIHNTVFSPDRRYRYWLEANLSDADGICMFLMLNPSKADEVRSDQTVTKSKGFAELWGYGTLWVCNLFALRTTFPKVLREAPEPIGDDNDEYILRGARQSDAVVCAWGDDGAKVKGGRVKHVLQLLDAEGMTDKMWHIGALTKNGQPRHPSRLGYDTKLIPWKS